MSIKVHIPTPLRPFVGGKDVVEVQKGDTIEAVLQELARTNSQLQKHLYDDQGKLRKFVNVYVNDEDIRYQNGNATPVKSGDVVSIVPSIAGGR